MRHVALHWRGQASAAVTAAFSTEGTVFITGYRIYRGTTGTPAFLSQVSGTTTAYRDSSTRHGVTYRYAVSAPNAAGEGPRSNEASAIAR